VLPTHQIRLKSLLKEKDFEEHLIEEILTCGRLKKAEKGAHLLSSGMKVAYLPFILSGRLRAYRSDDEGHEITLFYTGSGETCSFAVNSIINQSSSGISAVVEKSTEIWMVPGNKVDTWIVKYPNFRKFIFQSTNDKIDDLLSTFDSISFMKMGDRLYKYLLDLKHASGSSTIIKSHQQIAIELNTSRVVISRLMKHLSATRQIRQQRNRVELL
jgi:CRP/FNR family transcriptional regulator